jgi:hypothetical protein
MNAKIDGEQKLGFRVIPGIILGLALLGLVGCAISDGRPRALEADYGRSVTNSRLEMMVTPPDAVDPKPAVGLTPLAAQNGQAKYDKSFAEKRPERPVIPLLTTGSGQ